ncbi:MAG: PKD domain-containing protein, partial [Candidatus Hydrogenedentes bacterium]|nr:PKD domain-containing protein [Candidatus Hydrogenedentota bacterium]
NMPPRQRVAQLMAVTMAGGHQPTAEDLEYLKSYTPGAVIIRKILKPSYAAHYVTRLRAIEQFSGIPLWVGANIYRLTKAERNGLNEFVQLPSPLSLAAANDPDTTQALAELLAQHMNLMGFNLHLGPSLEMAPTLDSAMGTVYNFGSDPDFIGETFQITQRVFQEHGIVTVPLGFPGGGANRHKKSAAVLLTPPNLLDELDLAPYKQAIENGTPIIHVGSTLVPTLDPSGMPACVSPIVIGGMLRGKFAYEGIILAGPMDSQDVAGIIDPAEAAIRALGYGADMILWNGAANSEMRAVDKIVTAVNEERLSETKINAALKRLLEYKFEHLIQTHEILKSRQSKPLEYNKKLAQKIKSIEQKSITVVKNTGNILPLRKNKSMPVGVTGTIGVEILRDGLEKHFKPISQQRITTARHIGEIQDFEIQRITSHIRGIRTVICIFGESSRPAGQRRLIRELKAKGAQVVVVHLGYPRNVPQLALADAIVLAYCDSSKYEETLASMADILVGEGPVGFINIDKDINVSTGEERTFNVMDIVQTPPGRLPVTLSPQFPAGLSIPYDPQFAIKKILWEFGDGKKSKELRTVHAFSTPGRYPVSLSVTGPNGSSSRYTFHIVANAVQ